jgi:hypothetical protein
MATNVTGKSIANRGLKQGHNQRSGNDCGHLAILGVGARPLLVAVPQKSRRSSTKKEQALSAIWWIELSRCLLN